MSSYHKYCSFCEKEIFENMEALGNDIFAHKDCPERLNFEHNMKIRGSHYHIDS